MEQMSFIGQDLASISGEEIERVPAVGVTR
jgi:hypothetical protein